MNIEYYNYLTDYNSDERTYPMKPTEFGINAYYGRNDDVILVGGEDLWYIYWLSVTKVYDEEKNRQIVDYVLQMQPTMFGHRYIVLQSTQYTTEQLRTFYTAPVKQADDIILHLQEAKERCKSLETNGKFIQDMQHYLKVLSREPASPIAYYRKHKKLIERLQSMAFLFCSDNEQVRDLYEQLDKCCTKLYNAYMTEAH